MQMQYCFQPKYESALLLSPIQKVASDIRKLDKIRGKSLLFPLILSNFRCFPNYVFDCRSSILSTTKDHSLGFTMLLVYFLLCERQ